MRLSTRILGPLAVVGPILLILACESSSPTATPGTGGPGLTPEVTATRPDQTRTAGLGVPTAPEVTATRPDQTRTAGLGVPTAPEVTATRPDQTRTAGLGVPTATPVPAAAIAVAQEFARGHEALDQDWELFHKAFDTWRTGLISCDASSVSVSLQEFAGVFAGITEVARDLPRTSVVRGMADRMIRAAEGEEEALRALRDTWISGSSTVRSAASEGANFNSEDQNRLSSNPAGPSAFESVDVARSDASVLQKEVADELSDRQARVSSEGDVVAFSEEFQDIAVSWDQFHQDYDAFRAQEGVLTSIETVDQLSLLVDQFSNVVVSVRQLPTFESTRRTAQTLADAAQVEETALRNLRDTFRFSVEEPASEELSGEEPSGFGEAAASGSSLEEEGAGEGESEGTEESSEEAPAGFFIAEDPGLFGVFASQMVTSNEARRLAQLELADVLGEVSSGRQNEVQVFDARYQILVRAWDTFHRSYDEWRKTEGGCDRAEVVSELGRFALEFSDISSRVRGLPRATSLRPMGELFVEAARLEEQAFKELRNSWQPFDDGAFQALDRERSTADKLRRQVALGVQELLERYGLSEQATGS